MTHPKMALLSLIALAAAWLLLATFGPSEQEATADIPIFRMQGDECQVIVCEGRLAVLPLNMTQVRLVCLPVDSGAMLEAR